MYLLLYPDRAFILDWKSPNGMESFLNPLKIDWRSDTLFKDGLPQKYVHDIGGPYWFEDQGKNVQWYTNTNLNRYFSEDIEIVQGHSYDFTYALLRNRHHQEKIAQYGLHEVRCLLCCFWNNLFTFAPSLQRSMFNFLRRIQWSKTHDIIFVNVQIPNQHSSSRGHELLFGQSIVQCTEKAIRNLKLKKPVWILSSNSFVLLEGLMKSSHFQKEGRVYSKERYTVDIRRENATKTHTMILPRTEQNALYQFVTGYFLQLNSTVLVSDYRSVYAESMAAYRHFLHPGRYVVYHDNGCHLQRYGN